MSQKFKKYMIFSRAAEGGAALRSHIDVVIVLVVIPDLG